MGCSNHLVLYFGPELADGPVDGHELGENYLTSRILKSAIVYFRILTRKKYYRHDPPQTATAAAWTGGLPTCRPAKKRRRLGVVELLLGALPSPFQVSRGK